MGKATDVTIPDGVTSIEDHAFEDCTKFESVIIPDSVTGIQRRAFDGCKKLKIRASAGSYDDKYAKDNGIPFIAE